MSEFLGDYVRSNYCGETEEKQIGKTLTVMGWAAKRRDFGGLIFVDLRDRTGILQIVFDASAVPAEDFKKAESIRSEYVLAVKGVLRARSADTVNPKLATGTVELLARIRTALRHTRTDGTSDALAMTGEYRVGDLCVDYNKHRVYLAGKDTRLTPNEYKIVALLGRHAGQVLTYKSMMKELWGPGVGGDNKLLRVHMANIRRKIEPNPVEPQYIFTEVGVGYRMADSH